MERLNKMSLKKSFFTITFVFLLVGVLLAGLSFWSCIELRNALDTPNQFTMEVGDESGIPTSPNVQETAASGWRIDLVSALQVALPVIFVVLSLLAADMVFYRIKLKKPLVILQEGAGRIMENDLNFSIKSTSEDELGQLCTAFEAMRSELLKSNMELWRQMEERKRLNAAFSHDLRNPVTVLKGSAQILQKGLSQGAPALEKTSDTIALISEYATRIETYIEAMTNAQKLEELRCAPSQTQWTSFVSELCDSLSILGRSKGFDLDFHCTSQVSSLWLDKAIASNVAENLLANAMCYAKNHIQINLLCSKVMLTMELSDDGTGFPQNILARGAEPFLRGEETSADTSHFGMGLYICRLLCEKHGGTLSLKNTGQGASAAATFNILKP